MKSKIIFGVLIVLLLLISGCSMTNEEIVKEIKYCENNNLTAAMSVNNLGNVVNVVCFPKNTKRGVIF